MMENDRQKSENLGPKIELETPKAKFMSPPIFQNRKMEIALDNGEDHMPVRGEEAENSTIRTDTVLKIKDDDHGLPKPRNLLLLTPIKDVAGIPLTPITLENSPFQNLTSTTLFPVTSTQISQGIRPNNFERCNIVYVNKQTSSLHDLTSTPERTKGHNNKQTPSVPEASTPNTAPAKNINLKPKHYPVFQSTSKRRRKSLEREEDIPLASPLPSSPIQEVVNISSDVSNEGTFSGKENKPSYSSDDLFDEEIDKTSVAKKTDHKESKESTRKQKRKVTKDSSNPKLTENHRQQLTGLKSQVPARISFGDSDSDLDDFNLNTSLLGNRRTSKGKRTTKSGEKKGVIFSDCE